MSTYALLVLDADGSTTTLPTSKLSPCNNINKASRVHIINGKQRLLAEVLDLSASVDGLKKIQREWLKSHRNLAIEKEAKRRQKLKHLKEGGYLNIWPDEQTECSNPSKKTKTVASKTKKSQPALKPNIPVKESNSNLPQKFHGASGRVLTIHFEGAGNYSNNIAVPKRKPFYTDHLKDDERDMLQQKVIEMENNKTSLSTQTDQVIIASSDDDLRDLFGLSKTLNKSTTEKENQPPSILHSEPNSASSIITKQPEQQPRHSSIHHITAEIHSVPTPAAEQVQSHPSGQNLVRPSSQNSPSRPSSQKSPSSGLTRPGSQKSPSSAPSRPGSQKSPPRPSSQKSPSSAPPRPGSQKSPPRPGRQNSPSRPSSQKSPSSAPTRHGSQTSPPRPSSQKSPSSAPTRPGSQKSPPRPSSQKSPPSAPPRPGSQKSPPRPSSQKSPSSALTRPGSQKSPPSAPTRPGSQKSPSRPSSQKSPSSATTQLGSQNLSVSHVQNELTSYLTTSPAPVLTKPDSQNIPTSPVSVYLKPNSQATTSPAPTQLDHAAKEETQQEILRTVQTILKMVQNHEMILKGLLESKNSTMPTDLMNLYLRDDPTTETQHKVNPKNTKAPCQPPNDIITSIPVIDSQLYFASETRPSSFDTTPTETSLSNWQPSVDFRQHSPFQTETTSRSSPSEIRTPATAPIANMPPSFETRPQTSTLTDPIANISPSFGTKPQTSTDPIANMPPSFGTRPQTSTDPIANMPSSFGTTPQTSTNPIGNLPPSFGSRPQTSSSCPTVLVPNNSISQTRPPSRPLSTFDDQLQGSSNVRSMIMTLPQPPPMQCLPGPIIDIEKPDDILVHTNPVECRVRSSLQWKASSSTTSDTAFAWFLAKELYHYEELNDRNYNGNRGKIGLSPRRRHAIEHAIIDVYGYASLKNGVTGVNTGIRNLRRQKRQ